MPAPQPFKTYKHVRSRRSLPQAFQPVGAVIPAAVTIVSLKARLTFAAPVSVSGLPTGITRQAAGAGAQLAPTAFAVVSPTVLDLTYAASVVPTDVITIPGNVPQIRGIAGGLVLASTVTL